MPCVIKDMPLDLQKSTHLAESMNGPLIIAEQYAINSSS
jgi:hypothetical protein